MRATEREELNLIFRQFIKLFKSRCYTCRVSYPYDGSFTIHHRKYLCHVCEKEFPNTKKMIEHRLLGHTTDMIYSDFKKLNSKGNLEPDTLSYYKYLLPIILANPKRFRLLHNKHHYMAESWAKSSPLTFERTVKIAREINKRKFPSKH